MLSEPIEQHIQDQVPEDQLRDEDSLFGSPPPSPPARGRSPSPALALPSALSTGQHQSSSFGSIAQNVGTIALPGSHTHSEPPINPIASSLSLPGGSCTSFLPHSLPSSLPQSRQGSVGRNEPQHMAPPQSLMTHQAAEVGGGTEVQSRKQMLKRKAKPTKPRPPPPAIPLPDPSDPPPAHFLRNQQALLGHAGLIAGVKPSKLTTHGATTSRGASPSNPIVLEDKDSTAPGEPPIPLTRAHIEYFKNLDRSQLPTPTVQEVVDILIKQKDIFPVLQSILKLLAFGSSGGPGGRAPASTRSWASMRGQGQAMLQPPVKRRKLNRVPAGAVDWDVPYPFRDGEGPEAYRQNWAKERGRHLVSQLVGLVRVALDKAAAKRHIRDLVQRGDVGRVFNLLDGMAFDKGADHHPDRMSLPIASTGVAHSNTTIAPPPTTSQLLATDQESTPPPPTNDNDNAMLNDLFSALLSAPGPAPQICPNPPFTLTTSSSEPLNGTATIDDVLASIDLSSSTNENIDQSLIDSWMNILQTFPLPADGLQTNTPPVPNDTALTSLFGVDTPSDFSALASPASGDQSSFSNTPNPGAQQPLDFSAMGMNQGGDLDTALNNLAGITTPEQPQVQEPMDFTFDLPTLSRRNTSQNQPTPMDVDQPPISASPSTDTPPTHLVPNPPLNIDDLIDPCLLAISVPNAHEAAQSSTFGTTTTQPPVPTTNAENRPPSASLPSPVSTGEPATPSSAGWDITIPQVTAGEQHRSEGHERQSPAHEVGAVEAPKVPQTQPSIKKRASRPSQPSNTRSSRPAPASTTTSQPQPPGVFSVLRVEDLEPRKSVRKLKKTEVLKKAEEKREELRARLEQTRIKLWEASIEHGALLQLMRMAGEKEMVPSSSSSNP